MKRLFIALLLPQSLRQSAIDWQTERADWPVRWTKPENLHITLVPPWDERSVDTIIELLRHGRQSILTSRPSGLDLKVNLKFEIVSFGPARSNPRLIWASGPTPKGLVELSRSLHDILKKPLPARSFKLHLTLARFRPENLHSFSQKDLETESSVDWQATVHSLALIESHLLPTGAEYDVVEEFTL